MRNTRTNVTAMMRNEAVVVSVPIANRVGEVADEIKA